MLLAMKMEEREHMLRTAGSLYEVENSKRHILEGTQHCQYLDYSHLKPT